MYIVLLFFTVNADLEGRTVGSPPPRNALLSSHQGNLWSTATSGTVVLYLYGTDNVSMTLQRVLKSYSSVLIYNLCSSLATMKCTMMN